MDNNIRLAVLLTCHNRKEKTVQCLSSLYEACSKNEIYLVDDGSTDGTSEFVKKAFPLIHLLEGDGNLFWNRGMHAAWKKSLEGNFDYYLWLNDDIELYPGFLNELMECLDYANGNCIVTGLIEDEQHNIIYGGSDERKKLIQPSMTPQLVKYMNGNVVLVPKSVVHQIGILDPTFHHDLGDVDYGLTAIEYGIKVVATRTAIAKGMKNDYCRVRKWDSDIINRFKKLYSPLGANPKLNFHFRRKHFGIINASCYWAYLHFINILPDAAIYSLFGDKYIDKS